MRETVEGAEILRALGDGHAAYHGLLLRDFPPPGVIDRGRRRRWWRRRSRGRELLWLRRGGERGRGGSGGRRRLRRHALRRQRHADLGRLRLRVLQLADALLEPGGLLLGRGRRWGLGNGRHRARRRRARPSTSALDARTQLLDLP